MEVPPDRLLNLTIIRNIYYTNALGVALVSNTSIYFTVMRVRYIVLSSTFQKLTLWALSYYIDGNGTIPLTKDLTVAAPMVIGYGLDNMNGTGTTRSVLLITGFNVTLADGTNTLDVDVRGVRDPAQPFVLMCTITTTSAVPLHFHGMNFVSISWN
jgi:hypothetical protein